MLSHADPRYSIPLRATRWYAGYIFDLDGTTYLGDALLPTVAHTIAALRARGCRIAFLSNNPTHTRRAYVERLNGMGLRVSEQDIIHSTLVMARFLQKRQARGFSWPGRNR